MIEVGNKGDGFFRECLASQFVPIEAQVKSQGLEISQIEVVGNLLTELFYSVGHTG